MAGTFSFDPNGATGSITLSGGSDDICIDLIEGFFLFPEIRGVDWIVPRLDGEQPGNRRKGKLILPAAGYIRGTGGTTEERRETFNENVQDVINALDPTLGVGVITLADGYLGLASGETAQISARCRNGAPGKITGYNTFPMQLWTFEFEAYDPEWVFGS